MSSPWQVVGIFCDDIRQEMNNRISVMGIYPDNVNVSVIPGSFTRLAFYVRFHVDVNAAIRSVSIKIRLPSGEEQNVPSGFDEKRIKQAQNDSKAKGSPHAGLIFSSIMLNVAIKAAGRLELIALIDDQENVCASLNVQAQPQQP